MTRPPIHIHSSLLSRIVSEFIPLNRQRVVGGRPLSVDELDRLQELRIQLEMEFEGIPTTESAGSSPRSKRRSLRVPTNFGVYVQIDGERCEGSVVDLSDGGAFLSLEQSFAPGTPVFLDIKTQEPVREDGDDELPGGVGVRFENLDVAQQVAITDLVENVLTSF